MIEILNEIKEQLFDAPSEVKEAFNRVVGYFDDKEVFYVEYKDGSETKWYKFKATNKKDAERILNEWKKDYPDWIDYKTAKVIEEEYYLVTINGTFSFRSVKSWSECSKKFRTEDIKKGLKRKVLSDVWSPMYLEIAEGPFESKEKAENRVNKILEDRDKTLGSKEDLVWRTRAK